MDSVAGLGEKLRTQADRSDYYLHYISQKKSVRNCGISIWLVVGVEYICMLLKKIALSVSLATILLLLTSVISPAQAGFNSSCTGIEAVAFEDEYVQGSGTITIRANPGSLADGQTYFVALFRDTFIENTDRLAPVIGESNSKEFSTTTGTEFSVKVPLLNFSQDNVTVALMEGNPWIRGSRMVCKLGTIKVARQQPLNCSVNITQSRDSQTCGILNDANHCVERGSDLKIVATIKEGQKVVTNRKVNVDLSQQAVCAVNCWFSEHTNSVGQATFNIGPNFYPNSSGEHLIKISVNTTGGDYMYCNDITYNLSEGICTTKEGTRACGEDTGQEPIDDGPDAGSANPFAICQQIENDTLRAKCQTCAGGQYGRDGVWTAIGCIKRDPNSIIKSLMQIGLGMGGGVALLSTLAGGFILSTSQGNPQKADQAKEIITNSIIGLLFIIFSVVILQFIGVTIFNIPGFGTV